MLDRRRRTYIDCCFTKKLKPAIEMAAIHREGKMFCCWLTMVFPGHEGDRRPERAHAREVQIPIIDALIEDRPEQGVLAYPVVKRMNEALDHALVDAGAFNDFSRDLSAAFGLSHDHGRLV
jgi:hypothetical protein